jgi:hypothetical protein
MRVPIEEFSAKVRSGPPIDDEDDYSFPTWAGVVPLETVSRPPINDPRLDPQYKAPPYAARYVRANQSA